MTGSDTVSDFTSAICTEEVTGALLTHSVPFKSSALFPVDCSLLPPTKFILGVDVFFAAIFVGTADTLVLDVLLRDVFPVVVRPFTEEVAIDEVFTVQLFAAILEGEAVGFEADTAVEEVAWLTTFGSVDGIGLPSFVCNLTTF